MNIYNMILTLILPFISTFLCGFVLIPHLRKIKTGKFEARIGDRFQSDKNNTPKFGGIVILVGIIVGCLVGISVLKMGQELHGNSQIKQFVISVVYIILMCFVGLSEEYINERLTKLL